MLRFLRNAIYVIFCINQN